MGVLPLESVAETVDDSLGGEGAAETLLADDQVDGEGDLGVGRGTLRVKARMVLTSRMGLRCGQRSSSSMTSRVRRRQMSSASERTKRQAAVEVRVRKRAAANSRSGTLNSARQTRLGRLTAATSRKPAYTGTMQFESIMSERPSFVSRRSLSHDPAREKPNLLDLKITTHIAQLELTYASTLARLSADAALNFHQRDLTARPEDYALPAHLDDSHRRMHVVLDRIDQWLEDNICEDIAVIKQQQRYQQKQERMRELGRQIQEEEREIASHRRQMAAQRRGEEYERQLEKGAVRVRQNPELERSRNRFLNAKKDFDKQRKEMEERRIEAMALVESWNSK